MMNQYWSFLEPGDIVDIIAPSSTVSTNELLSYYQETKAILAGIGLIAHIPDDLIDLNQDLFSANSLEYRSRHLIDSLTNKKSKAVWAIRGGYGAAKLIPALENIEPPKKAKLLLGFSDITALHLFLENKWHWSTMHSAVINQIIHNPKLLEELKPIIFGKQTSINYHQLIPLNGLALENKTINASITGGNLSLVQTSLATSWQINANNKIIFLEDVNEQGYKIDRMLNQLLQASIFKSAKALIFGEFTPPKMPENKIDLCSLALKNFALLLNIPVLSLPIIGHNINHNSPLALGVESKLTLGSKALLTCSSGGKKL